jgi:hypothetical protein
MANYYEITVKGHLDPPWSDWFAPLEISQREGDLTLFSGLIEDQAALHGLLRRIRDLNLTLISVNHITSTHPQMRKGDNHEEF